MHYPGLLDGKNGTPSTNNGIMRSYTSGLRPGSVELGQDALQVLRARIKVQLILFGCILCRTLVMNHFDFFFFSFLLWLSAIVCLD